MLFPTMLRRANGVLYLRRVIPKAYRAALGGRREIKVSLKTRDAELGKQRWKLASLKVDALLDAAKRGVAVSLPSRRLAVDDEQRDAFESYLATALEWDEDGTRPLSHVQRARFKAHFQAPPEGTPANPLLTVALARGEQELQPTAKTAFQWAVALNRFRTLACSGVDLPVKAVTRAHLVAFKDALLNVPARGRRLAEDGSYRKRTLAPASAVKDINAIKALLGMR